MVVLITGASGFVGGHLFTKLQHRVQVRPVVRTGIASLPGAVTVPDVGPDTDWTSALEGCSTVVHLAAQLPSRNAAAADYDRVNRLGTSNLVKQAQQAGAKKFIFMSSIAAVAGAADGQISDDDYTVAANDYGRSKRSAEQAVAGFSGESISLRPPLIIGRGARGNWGALTKLAALPAPLPFGLANRERSFLSIDNLLDALTMLIERVEGIGAANAYAIADPDPISLADLVSSLRTAQNRRPMLLPIPLWIMEKSARLAGKGALTDSLFGSLIVDSSRFNREFRWSPPVTTRETIVRSV